MKDKVLEVIRGLFEGNDRPEDIEAVDIALTVFLILKGALASPVRGSLSTLGIALSVSEPTVSASIRRLQSAGWIQKHSGKSRRSSNTFAVVREKLPVAQELQRTVISADAWSLADRYTKVVPTNSKGKQRRFSKAERQRFAFALQTYLDRHTDGDVELLRGVINFAFKHPKYATKARRGPHELRRSFKKLLQEFKASTATQQPRVEHTETVYTLQGFTAVGTEGLRQLLSGPNGLHESEDCVLTICCGAELKEHHVNVINFGGKFGLLDVATGRGLSFDTERAA
jgi:DNA-binding MarR family transcriptional regulator